MIREGKNRILVFLNYKPNTGITNQVLDLKSDLEQDGNEVRLLNTHGNPVKRLMSIFKGIAAAGNTDVVLGIGCAFKGFFPSMVAATVAYLRRKPIVFNFHDGQAAIYLKDYHKFARFFIRNKEVVVATKFVADAFESHGFKVKEIPNHFDFEASFPKRNKAFQWNRNLVWARSFEELYQPELAIKSAIALLGKTEANFQFFGKGSLREELVQKYHAEGLVFEGAVNRDVLLNALCNCSVFVNTTQFDNFPLSIVEAGYLGLLVVTTKVGGIASLFTDEDLVFFDDKKEGELERVLQDILDNPEKYEARRLALQEKVKQFTWRNVKEDWYKALNIS